MNAAFEPDREQWQRLKTVLTKAMKRSPSERQALLQQELGENAQLRDYALDMLQYYDNASRPFDVSRTDAVVGGSPIRGEEPVRVGESISHYHVLRKLGEGGMGVVFLAQDERLGRQVALKFLSAAVRNSFPDSKEQLYSESRAVAVLNHPAIVTLHDVFETDDEFVTVMEYVEGRALSDMVRGAPMPIGYALRLMYQLSDALAYAHGRGIIHCDLKPANIHVLPTGAPKILDFGLARAIVRTTEKAEPSDRPIFGTMGYIAPERLLGREPSAAADMYALGVIFYQLLTGSEPFAKDDEGQLFLDTVTATPLPPSKIAGGISPEVDSLVLRCLAKSPRERLQPHELARGIDSLLQEIDTRTIVRPLVTKADSRNVAVTLDATGDSPSPFLDRLTKAATYALAALAVVTLLGLITSISYQRPLGLVGRFSGESALLWPLWGIRSLLAVAGTTLMLWLIAVAVFGACRIGGALSPRLQGACISAARPLNLHLQRLTSLPSSSQASALLLLQLAAVGALIWRFQRIIQGVNSFSTGSYNALHIFNRQNLPEFEALAWWLGAYLLIFGFGWVRVARTARRNGAQDSRALLWGGAVVTAFTLIVFQTVPYRVFYHNASQRVSYDGKRCYLVGGNGEDLVVFCPDQDPPWTTVVKASDPSLEQKGVVENIFSGLTEH